MEEKDTMPTDVLDGLMESAQDVGVEVEFEGIPDGEEDSSGYSPDGGAGESMSDEDREDEPAAPVAEVGVTAVDAITHEESEAQSAETGTMNEAPDWTELCTAYPDVDPADLESDTTVCALLRGEIRPTPRQAYEITHLEAIVEARVAERIEAAVRESEARILDHIRTCGQRPVENGVRAAVGVRMHPAVGRLTRSDRAALARRAERGETIRL